MTFAIAIDAVSSFCVEHTRFSAVLLGAVGYLCFHGLSQIQIRWPLKMRSEQRSEASDRSEILIAGMDDNEGSTSCSSTGDESAWRRAARRVRCMTWLPALALWIAAVVALLLLSRSAWSDHHESQCMAWRVNFDAAFPTQANNAAADPSPVRAPNRWKRNLAAAVCPSNNESAICGTQPSEVERARLAHAAWLPQCVIIGAEMQALRKGSAASKRSVGSALRLLFDFNGLAEPFRKHMVFLGQAGSDARQLSADSTASDTGDSRQDVQEELRGMIANSRTCMVQTMQEARLLAAMLPIDDDITKQTLKCYPSMLEGTESFIISDAEQDSDAAVLFALGLYWSERGVAMRTPPLFGAASDVDSAGWVDDGSAGQSRSVPTAVAKAEEFLLRGQEVSQGSKKTEYGAMQALRLYQHAKSLALMHHDSAAEWRYLAAARVASANHRPKLASHSLTRLSYFLSLRSRSQKALDMAEMALTHGPDPLAEYLKATLRRSLGELRTSMDIDNAVSTMSSVAGKLPSQALEQQRAAAHEEIWLWRQTASAYDAWATLGACLAMQDAARFLLCAIGSFSFESTQLGPLAEALLPPRASEVVAPSLLGAPPLIMSSGVAQHELAA